MCIRDSPGSHTGQGAEEGIRLISEMLNEILKPEQTTTVLLETMAGKGTEVGHSFEELAAILERVELKDHMGVCLDTCHVYDCLLYTSTEESSSSFWNSRRAAKHSRF